MKNWLLKMRTFWFVLVLLPGTLAGGIRRAEPLHAESDSLPPLKDGQSPQTVEEAWAGYDPQTEPLDVEMIKEWEKEGVVLRAVRYRQ